MNQSPLRTWTDIKGTMWLCKSPGLAVALMGVSSGPGQGCKCMVGKKVAVCLGYQQTTEWGRSEYW